MTKMSEPLTFTVPLSFEAHAIARQFQQQQTDVQKAKQVYLKALAVNAVDVYLRCLGFETDIEESDSVNSVYLKFMNVGDLWVKSIGQLECLPVLPEAGICQLLIEAQLDRIGFVAVQLERSLKQATVLGFAPTVTTELPLNQLRSLSELPAYLNNLRQTPQRTPILVHLRQWFENLFESGWQDIESLLNTKQLATSFRLPSTQRGKIIRLANQTIQQEVVLVVKLVSQSEKEMRIVVEVHPIREQSYLPEALQVNVLDEQKTSVMQAIAGTENQNIQFDFNGELGERFSIQMILGDLSIVEEFVV